MTNLLEDYIRKGRYAWGKRSLPQIAEAATYQARDMGRTEIRERLAELDLRSNQSGKHRLELLRAADQHPTRPKVLELLGAAAKAQRDDRGALEYWKRAIDSGSTNPAIYYEVGVAERQHWFSRFDYNFRIPYEHAAELRKLYKRSIELTPDQAEAYQMLAWVEASVDEPDVTNINLVQKRFPTLVRRASTLVALALVRIHLGDLTEASQLLDRAEAMSPGAALGDVIRIIRSRAKISSSRDETRSSQENDSATR